MILDATATLHSGVGKKQVQDETPIDKNEKKLRKTAKNASEYNKTTKRVKR